jgi:uncharacterized protein
MRTTIAALLLVGLCMSGVGLRAEDQDAARRVLAEQLLNEMDMKGNMEKTFAMFKKMIPSHMEQMRKATDKTIVPEGTDKETADAIRDKAAKASVKMMDEVMKEMSWDSIKDDFVSLYAETFTEEELQGLVAFYKSPAGRAFTKKQPELMKRSMQLTQKRMVQWMPKIQAMSKEMMDAARKDAKKSAPPAEKPKKDSE